MITELRFNWRQVATGLDDMGEDYDWAEVEKPVNGKKDTPIVQRIEEHEAKGEGDKWFYDILLADGTAQRVFKPNRVFYGK